MTPYFSQSPFFEANINLLLKLESDGKNIELPTGNIEKFCLDLRTYGYTSTLQFVTFDKDEIDEMFKAPKIIKVTVTFLPIDLQEGTKPIFEIKGIVTHRSFKRLPATKGKEEQAHRSYEIHFCDPAKATWEQHFPTNIYVDESMKDIIEKHVNPEITINYDWDHLEAKHPTTAFSLPHQPGLSLREQANFYSFMMWYLHQENGMLAYDYKDHNYTITGKKKEASGDPLKIPEWEVMPPLCTIAQVPRYNSKTINHTVDDSNEQDQENEHSFKSVRREVFDSVNHHLYPEHAKEKIQSTLISEKNEIEVELGNFTKEIQINKLTPGSFVSFVGDQLGNWTRDDVFKDKKFRIRSLYFDAHKMGVSEETDKKIQHFGLYVKLKLEEADDTFLEWPQFVPPTYPFYVHGKIFCDIGEKEQSTYKIQTSEQTPKGQYLVVVPIAGKDKKVVAPFVPFSSGQDYYPLSKDAQVMMSMYFRTAKIDRPIEWDPLARLPVGTQGNQTVFSSNGQNKYTLMRHEYMDGKNSVLTIKQSSSEEQAQTLQIQEKDIQVLVDTKDKKTLTLQLNSDSGFLLSLEDKEGTYSQQIIFDGTTMTHICKDSGDTSTIVQKPNSISMECKEFSVTAETILLNAKDTITQTGTNSVDIETKVANIAASSVKLG